MPLGRRCFIRGVPIRSGSADPVSSDDDSEGVSETEDDEDDKEVVPESEDESLEYEVPDLADEVKLIVHPALLSGLRVRHFVLHDLNGVQS